MSKKTTAPCAGYLVPWQLAGVPKDTPVLLAFSGGADSRALLHLLAESAKKDGFPLLAAHVSHGIRGEEGLRDREFCRRTAQTYGVELCLLDADVPALAEQSGRGLEEEAREVRYAYFEELMRTRGIPLLVTAHHADDHFETLLFRICRGSGLHGLGGIASVRPFAQGYLVRPLLRCTRREILEYCEANALEFVTDSTNADTLYARNRIRAEVTPVLDSLFDGVAVRTVEMSEELREDEAYLASLADDFFQKEQTPRGLAIDALRELPLPIRKRVLRRWVREMCGRDAARVHIDALLALVGSVGQGNTEAALPQGCVAVCELGYLRILPPKADGSAQKDRETEAFSFAFCEGEYTLLDGAIRVCVQKEENGRKVHNLSTQTCINSQVFSVIIKNGLYWRVRREGDVILMGGMHRKLRKLYNAAKIPARMRDAIPLLCDEEGIVWAPFAGNRDGLENADGERYTVCVEIG